VVAPFEVRLKQVVQRNSLSRGASLGVLIVGPSSGPRCNCWRSALP
jgi:hypothetical protein